MRSYLAMTPSAASSRSKCSSIPHLVVLVSSETSSLPNLCSNCMYSHRLYASSTAYGPPGSRSFDSFPSAG
ncbi:hypothetical protein BDV29DRAFT_177106 [Aspergillus leporis]|uniref:Uncharacterized protein n=1 Tax=Aspergillus leporis TaxID=41062 RepID=A0A5N5WW69_9EURO|nr:hypothetical protein BDV29DRAFT_177106 [Aspergillus leporis]